MRRSFSLLWMVLLSWWNFIVMPAVFTAPLPALQWQAGPGWLDINECCFQTPIYSVIGFPSVHFTQQGILFPSSEMTSALWKSNQRPIKLLGLYSKAVSMWDERGIEVPWMIRKIQFEELSPGCSSVVGEMRTHGTMAICVSPKTYFPGQGGTASDKGWTTVMVHEIGHSLGLVHVKNKSDVMYAALGNGFQVISDNDVSVARRAMSGGKGL